LTFGESVIIKSRKIVKGEKMGRVDDFYDFVAFLQWQ